jgi:trans-aconitate methyltransferase
VNTATVHTKWDADLYQDKHDFVFKYGEDLVDLLDPKPGERILDLGCGTGYLTHLITTAGARTIGIDNSPEMIEKAKKEYPGIDFEVLSATDFHFPEPFDAIFSNAVLHWVLEKQKAIDCMYTNLKKGGRLVLEMGGKGNVAQILEAMRKAVLTYPDPGKEPVSIWYFPSLSAYASLLEARGFRVTYARHYDRETELKDSTNGIRDWIRMFGASLLKDMDANAAEHLLSEIQDSLRSSNFRNGKWYADYKRLRIIAIKED